LTEVALGYQRMLELDPFHAEALVGMSLVAIASQQSKAAVTMAEAAVAAAPRMGAAWVTLGQALKGANRNPEAERAYAEAIRMDGMDVLARRVASFRNVTGELRAFLSRIRRRRVDEKPINRQAILQDTEPGW
jgi:Flp pilus assembly protein TadD